MKRVVPYATFNFTPFDVPAQSREFDEALKAAQLTDLLLPLRPFDAATPDDLSDTSQASMRRQYGIPTACPTQTGHQTCRTGSCRPGWRANGSG